MKNSFGQQSRGGHPAWRLGIVTSTRADVRKDLRSAANYCEQGNELRVRKRRGNLTIEHTISISKKTMVHEASSLKW